jgi:hypothetical protein
MSDDHFQTCIRDSWIDDFAAELTNVAYPILLRRGFQGSWIEAELGLWKSLAETIRAWTH